MNKVIVENLQNVFKGDNLKQITAFLEEHGENLKEGLERAEKAINKATEFVEKKTYKPCVMISIEKLDIQNLKEIIRENRIEEAHFVALLDLGRNENDKLELFMQYLNRDKKAVIADRVFCLRCDMKSADLKEAFGDKNMLLINL
ncbi:hypothetical protein KRX57_01360 [Weeksellaceae bacterium TAE3-ERU29]|nr:hypothetical protein [Weeksellaceae bacterium TAE3-ERU29]